jgi:hypothetical protein
MRSTANKIMLNFFFLHLQGIKLGRISQSATNTSLFVISNVKFLRKKSNNGFIHTA